MDDSFYIGMLCVEVRFVWEDYDKESVDCVRILEFLCVKEKVLYKENVGWKVDLWEFLFFSEGNKGNDWNNNSVLFGVFLFLKYGVSGFLFVGYVE